MALNPSVRTLKALIGLNASTQAEFESENPVLIENALYLDTTNSILKLGDGTHTWTETPVYYDPANNTPAAAPQASVKWVADIAARDALDADGKKGLVMVVDASADPTVTDENKKTAGYVWDETANSGAGDWVKIFEQESLDVDLSGYFDKTTDTADDIQDGENKVMMTTEERQKLTDLGDLDDIVRYSHSIYIQGLNAQELNQAQEPSA